MNDCPVPGSADGHCSDRPWPGTRDIITANSLSFSLIFIERNQNQNKMPITAYYAAIGTGATFVVAFITEYALKRAGVQTKPSTVLTIVADWSWRVFEGIGRWVAKISSFLTYIDLDDVWATFRDLFTPIARICWSPMRGLYGYATEACSAIYKNPWSIYVGSAILIAGAAFVTYKYDLHKTCWSCIYGYGARLLRLQQ